MQFRVIVVTDPQTHTQTNRQDRLQYTAPQLARSVTQLSLMNRASARRIYAICNGAADLQSTRSPYVFPRRIWSFHVKGCRHNYGDNHSIWGRWNFAAWDWAWLTSEICLSPYELPCWFGRSSSNDTNVIKEIHLKNFTGRVPPFKATQGHRNRHGSIGYQLTFHSNHGPILYRFRDKRRFQSRIAKFFLPAYI